MKTSISTVPTKRSVLIVLLLYSATIFVDWFVVFTSVKRFPALYDPKDPHWSLQVLRIILFDWQRNIVILLLPVGVFISWVVWQFVSPIFVEDIFIPYHRGKFLARLAPSFFKERSTQNYFLVESYPTDKSFKSIVKASVLPFSALLSIAILVSRDLNYFPTFIKQPPFSLQILILLISSVFTNIALYIILPVLAFIAPSIWILEESGLRYFDPIEKVIVGVVDDYRAVVGGVLGIGAVTSFISLLYDIMINNGLGFDYLLGYLSYVILLLYPPILLATALYIHYSKDKSIEKVLKKLKKVGFPLPQISTIDLKQ
jgi:hypothetical protein